jgi:preprotein translocase subunit SecE
MAIVREKDKEDAPEDAAVEDAQPKEDALAKVESEELEKKADDAGPEEDEAAPVAAPMQLGTRRFVYAAYFAGFIAVTFLSWKLIGIVWYRLDQWKPTTFGEPRDDLGLVIAAVIGIGVTIYYWYRGRARQLAEEVATELSKVTWPGRTEVVNSTFVTIVTTLVATVFFALMDRFWGFVTNLVYGS